MEYDIIESNMDLPEEAISDQVLLERTANSFYHYKDFCLQEIWKPRILKWKSLSTYQKQLIPWYEDYLNNIRDCIESNSIFYMNLLEKCVGIWGLGSDPNKWATPNNVDMGKTVSILNQVAREWSADCSEERDCFLALLKDFLDSEFPHDRRDVKVLVPGAGLARLAVDIARMGFSTEANEVSYHMIMVGQFIMDSGLQKDQIGIYPFVHSFSHHLNRREQLRRVNIPDINIAEELRGKGLLSMVTGSFPDLYGPNTNIKQSDSYSNSAYIREIRARNRSTKDLVVTNFFIDTASNVLDYLETISHVLKDGGYWINFGPFMYHFEQDPQTEITADFNPYTGEVSNMFVTPLKGLELSHEDILSVASTKFPFKIIHEQSHISSGYGTNKVDISMQGYQCSFWILQKSCDKVNNNI